MIAAVDTNIYSLTFFSPTRFTSRTPRPLNIGLIRPNPGLFSAISEAVNRLDFFRI